jgi:hypothetical protein
LADGFPNRYSEFQDFERKFEECISKSAVRTKFEQHSQTGKLIVSEIRQIMDSTYDQAQQLKTQKAKTKIEIHDQLNITKQQKLPLTQEMKDKILQMVADVDQKVSCFSGTSVTCTEGTQCCVHVVLMSPYLYQSLNLLVFHLQYQLDTVIYWTAWHQVFITNTLEMETGSVS